MPDPIQLTIWIAIISLLLCSAFFSAAETAYSSLNVIRVKQIARSSIRKRAKKATIALKIFDKYDYFLSTVLIFNNIVNVTLSSLLTYLFTTIYQWGGSGVVIATLTISALIIIVGEIVPKNVAKVFSEQYAMMVARVILILIYILTPITIFFAKLNKQVERLADEENTVTATESELVDIVETIEKEGVLEQDESELIVSAINFDDKTVAQVMHNKEDTVTFGIDTPLEEVVKAIVKYQFSRYPILSLDDEVIGIIQQRDIFKILAEKEEKTVDQVVKQPIYLSYRRSLREALSKLQRNRQHMAIVVDNLVDKKYLGIVTLEDILEELVGEIYDEHDTLPVDVVRYGHHTYEVDGHYDVLDFFDFLDETYTPKVRHQSLDKWVRSLFKYKGIKVGATINYDNLIIKVLEVDKKVKMIDRKNLYIKKIEISEITKKEED